MKSLKPLLLTLAGLALLPVASLVQAQTSRNEGYLVDSRSEVVRSGAGQCWHLSSWTPALAVEGCEPVLKPVALQAPLAPRTAQAPAPAPQPAPMVLAPTAAPLLLAQTAPPKTLGKRFSFSGDALFGFDKSVLRPESMSMLDDFVHQIDGAMYDVIEVTGHADRIGNPGYNQSLSERRAVAVKDYLVSHNVKAGRIDAQGKGETEPVAETADCKGAKSKALIACLQPDRRVDIEMKGTAATADAR